MMPCSSDFVPSMRLWERRGEGVPADALVERTQLEQVQHRVVDVEGKGERGVDVEERVLLTRELQRKVAAHLNVKYCESIPWKVTISSRIKRGSAIYRSYERQRDTGRKRGVGDGGGTGLGEAASLTGVYMRNHDRNDVWIWL